MAQKRMFDRAIIDTDRFMDLPISAKALYFLLGMDADDEGFVSPRKIQRVHGGNDDDIKLLIAKNFVIPFKSGIVVITDWKNNNWLDSRRIKPTKYQAERELLAVNKDNSYSLSSRLASVKPEECSVEEKRIEQTRAKKVANPFFEEFWIAFPKKIAKAIAQRSWNKINPDENMKTIIIAAIAKHKSTEQWQKNDGQFIPHPATWLNQRRWEDEVQVVTNKIMQSSMIPL
jgi:hypothetical protein